LLYKAIRDKHAFANWNGRLWKDDLGQPFCFAGEGHPEPTRSWLVSARSSVKIGHLAFVHKQLNTDLIFWILWIYCIYVNKPFAPKHAGLYAARNVSAA